MQVAIKQLRGKQWVDFQGDTDTLDQYQGTDTVAVLAEGIIWCGNEKWRNKYEGDPRFHTVTDTTGLLPAIEYAHKIFWENREERQSICEADNVPKEIINQIFEQYPMIYGGQP